MVMICNEVLFWPIGVSPTKGDFVVGWEDALGSEIKVSSHYCSTEPQHYNQTRTVICAFTVNAVKGDDKSRNGITFDNLRLALSALSDHQQFKCLRDRDLGCKPPNRSEVACCWPCSMYGSLKVLGIWEPYPDNSQCNNLPQFISTLNGPWEKSPSRINYRKQLVMYERCGGLQYYCHRARRSADVDGSCMTRFQKSLARISEAESIEKELKHIIQSETIILEKGEHQDPVSIQRSSADGDATQKKEFQPTTLLRQLNKFLTAWSLSILHWNGACIGHSSNPDSSVTLLRHFPLFYACYLFCCKQRKRDLDETTARPRIANVGSYSAIHAMFDGFLGLAVGVAIVSNTSKVQVTISAAWELFHRRLLRDNIGWLETFPVGFKLNVPLTRNMGQEILILMKLFEWSTFALIGAHQHVAIFSFGVAGIAFGFVMLSALLFDLIRLATLHISVVTWVFGKMQKAQVHTLSSLWKLFRGKKRNVLRSRTDTLEYDSMQLLLGTVLFTTCLFLCTTILVYYTFFTVVNLFVTICVVSAWMLYFIVQGFPLRKLSQVHDPMLISENVYFAALSEDEEKKWLTLNELERSDSGQPISGYGCVKKLVSAPQTKKSILSDAYSSHFGGFVSHVLSYLMGIPLGCSSPIANAVLLDAREFYQELQY